MRGNAEGPLFWLALALAVLLLASVTLNQMQAADYRALLVYCQGGETK